MFPVYDLTSSAPDRPETLGSKEKFWLTPNVELGLPPEPHLFKIGRAGTGENWSEKVSCEIARLLEMPSAEYNFATFQGTPGVISERMFPAGGAFIPANLILPQLDDQYDGSLRFKQVRYKLSVALNCVRRLPLMPPMGYEQTYPHLSVTGYFVGYLLFDALIGNTDRHHENWGVVVANENGKNVYHLAATFDHASSLGRELTDEKRSERLTTNDTRANVEAYASRGRSAFYDVGANPKLLTNLEVVSNLAQSHPEATKFWAQKITGISSQSLEDIFNRITNAFIPNKAAEFAIRLLMVNQGRIKEIADGS